MPTMGESTFGASTEYQQKSERAFYAEWSKRHPPKNRVSLLEQEELRMKQLCARREEAVGFSESFLSRRRFPIKHDESQTEHADQIPSPQPDSSPRARFAE